MRISPSWYLRGLRWCRPLFLDFKLLISCLGMMLYVRMMSGDVLSICSPSDVAVEEFAAFAVFGLGLDTGRMTVMASG